MFSRLLPLLPFFLAGCSPSPTNPVDSRFSDVVKNRDNPADRLRSNGTVKAGITPSSVAIAGKYAYVTNSNGGNVMIYGIARDGTLESLGTSPVASGWGPNLIAIDPSGKYAYTANTDSTSVSAYVIDRNGGALKPVSGSPFRAGNNPTFIAITPSGKYA